MMKIIPNAPLFRDPLFDGAADPVVIWNKKEEAWWMFYTNRRAWGPNNGVTFMHGTDIGIASSKDGCTHWIYRGIAKGLEIEEGRNTFWAPEIIEHQGKYHMYVSYVQGIPSDWECDRKILYYSSDDLWNWKFESEIKLSSNRVIDACLFQLPDSTWKMWYKDEVHNSHTYSATSSDLYHWKVSGAEITDCQHEGPNVFSFQNHYWMITDPWEGLGVYRSEDCSTWSRCPNILNVPGDRADDNVMAAHADVLVRGEHAYIYYFTHPERREGRTEADTGMYQWNRSAIQVAELKEENGILTCDRNRVQF